MATTFGKPLASFTDERLEWLNMPGADAVKGAEDGSSLKITPVVGRDFWARTFYGPSPMIKADGCALVAPVPPGEEATLSVGFTLNGRNQFDQAGALIYVDDRTFVKAGIEFCDKVPRLSVVVTNEGFSDWSTQLLPFDALRLRVSKIEPGEVQGPALLVEAAPYEEGAGFDTPGDWQFVRVASLRSAGKPWKMGVYAACPIKASRASDFHYLHIGPKLKSSHSQEV
jgi:regulation of enolase protein 1 (concanavalin A-like superfamily)